MIAQSYAQPRRWLARPAILLVVSGLGLAAAACQKTEPAAQAPAEAAVAAPAAELPPAAGVALPETASPAAGKNGAPPLAEVAGKPLPPGHPPVGGADSAPPLPPGSGEALPPGHPPLPDAPAIAIGEFAAADLRIAELRKQRANYGGKAVRIRGRVVKVNSGILGRNWLHLQDGSEGKLVVTSTAEAAPGALVLATGKLAVDKDLGAGYQYDILLEDATLEVEQPAP